MPLAQTALYDVERRINRVDSLFATKSNRVHYKSICRIIHVVHLQLLR